MRRRADFSSRLSIHEFADVDEWSHCHSVVSLHAHTYHSREVMGEVPAYIAQIPLLRAWFARRTQRYLEEEGQALDFSKGCWHPPLGPRQVFESEVRQIESRFGLTPLVSITDHDQIAAGLDVQRRYARPCAPVSVEWTVPSGRGFLHVGVHNLPPDSAHEWFARLSALTDRTGLETLEDLFHDLNRQPDLLIVLNHPCWDLARVGDAEHRLTVRRFLMTYGRYVHAIELNGYRSRTENTAAHALARALSMPVISGGDRHGCTPNALLNVTRATCFAEFAAELRDGMSHVIVMPEYHRHLTTRKLETAYDVLRAHPSLPAGHRYWTDRVSWDLDGTWRPLSFHWQDGAPLAARSAVQACRMLTSPVVLPVIRASLESVEALRRGALSVPTTPRPGPTPSQPGDGMQGAKAVAGWTA
jgi:hypothetical protein